MMVYASNQPAQFDAAVMDRIDEMVAFDLPGPEERKRMIAMYIEKYLLNPPGRWAKPVTTEDIGDAEIDEVVNLTDGFSGRAISKLAIAWQAAAYGTQDAKLDRAAFFMTVANHKKSLGQKEMWLEQAQVRARMLTADL
jgi:ATPase family AAA domain-containing protein 3A/B